MQSRLLGAMRRLVYVADKAAINEAAVAQRDAYVNRLEQQLVTQSIPAKSAGCKGTADTLKAVWKRPTRRCQSSGPIVRSQSPSPRARGEQGLAKLSSARARAEGSSNSTPSTLARPGSRQPPRATDGNSYRQKHEENSKSRRRVQSALLRSTSMGNHSHSLGETYEGSSNSHQARLDSLSLVAAPPVEEESKASTPHSQITGESTVFCTKFPFLNAVRCVYEDAQLGWKHIRIEHISNVTSHHCTSIACRWRFSCTHLSRG